MKSSYLLTIAFYAVITAVLALIVLRFSGYEGSVTIASAAAGGVAGALAAMMKKRKANGDAELS
jgi:hypothetical protein